MKLFKNLFKKKEPTYPDELQDCLDRLERVKASLIRMQLLSEADHEAAAQVVMLNEEYYRWLSVAERQIRYREYTCTSSYGQVKINP